MVASATFVCRGYTYTDETLIEVDYHITSSGDSIGIASTACHGRAGSSEMLHSTNLGMLSRFLRQGSG